MVDKKDSSARERAESFANRLVFVCRFCWHLWQEPALRHFRLLWRMRAGLGLAERCC